MLIILQYKDNLVRYKYNYLIPVLNISGILFFYLKSLYFQYIDNNDSKYYFYILKVMYFKKKQIQKHLINKSQ